MSDIVTSAIHRWQRYFSKGAVDEDALRKEVERLMRENVDLKEYHERNPKGK